MARTKEFDRFIALQRAIRVFSQKGYAAASTDDLMRAMGIGRQSMYDTFGDKRTLFLTALREYAAASCGAFIAELRKPGAPLEVIQKALITFAARKDMVSGEGCMGLNALSEFGVRDGEVNRTIGAAASSQRTALRKLLLAAVERGELSRTQVDSALDFIDATLAGIRYAAKAGKSRKALSEMAAFAGGALAK
jgi:TetR/AcrR family transcriptional regulator, transcriptional repressor for nem operon